MYFQLKYFFAYFLLPKLIIDARAPYSLDNNESMVLAEQNLPGSSVLVKNSFPSKLAPSSCLTSFGSNQAL